MEHAPIQFHTALRYGWFDGEITGMEGSKYLVTFPDFGTQLKLSYEQATRILVEEDEEDEEDDGNHEEEEEEEEEEDEEDEEENR